MFDRYKTQGSVDALRRFGLTKEANDVASMSGPTAGAGATGGMWDKAKAFGHGQWGAAKSLAGNLHQGLGGAATPELGQAARAGALGNVKTLAPSLLAGGGLYLMHRHNQAKQQEQQRQQAMMMGGGYPTM